LPWNLWARIGPPTAPAMIAANVVSSSTPFPHDRRFGGRSSGSNPYFEGPNSAACVLARKTAANERVTVSRVNASVANSMTPSSNTFVAMVTWRLLNLSARNPPVIENRTNGAANRKPISRTHRSFWSCVGFFDSARKITKNFRAFSLNAPWNCVAIRLQKPRRQLVSLSGVKKPLRAS